MGISDLIAKIKAWDPKYTPTKPDKGQKGGINPKNRFDNYMVGNSKLHNTIRTLKNTIS